MPRCRKHSRTDTWLVEEEFLQLIGLCFEASAAIDGRNIYNGVVWSVANFDSSKATQWRKRLLVKAQADHRE